MLDKILGNKKILFIIDIVLLIISITCYKYIFEVELVKNTFSNESVKFAQENKNPIFKVGKIILYSSAHAIDNSSEGQLQDIDISQFTDIAIYIDNKSKSDVITAENTINEMYIDNIKVEVNTKDGEKILNYKNPNKFGKYSFFENYLNDGILFNVAKTNDELSNSDYENNLFYTDCSNPISLGFINRNLLTGCKISTTNGSLSFDGSILKSAKINLNEISGKIKMSIHIKNNLNEEFVCNLNIDNDLTNEEIYSGYAMKIINTSSQEYNFLKISK